MSSSLQSIMATGLSGLVTAQTQLQVVSDNVTNADTPGYVRKIADQVSTGSVGAGTGVDITGIRLAVNQFLEAASQQATSAASQAGAISNYYNQIQSLFGDPSSNTGFLSQIDQLFSSFSTLSANPTSTAQRDQTLSDAQQLFSQASSIYSSIQQVRADADSQISSDVTQVNNLLQQIENLNVGISRGMVSGADVTGAENDQAQLINQLSSLMDIKVAQRPAGGVTVRTTDGVLLAGDGAATLSYAMTGTVTGQTNFNAVTITPPGGQPVNFADHLQSGEIEGLLQLRDQLAPQAASQLSQLVSNIADQINGVANANTASPPPQTLTGVNIGLDLPSAISGFSGKTNIDIIDGSGVVQHQVSIDFGAGTMSFDGGAAQAFTPATFLTTLNTTLGANGSATFSNGVLSLSASTGNGVAVVDDATTPSNNGGRGFSWYFGLNNIVQSSRLTNYQTGLNAASANNFTAGQSVSFKLTNSSGAQVSSVSVAIPSGGTMASVLAALNTPAGGVGAYGTFAFDSNGQLSFTPSGNPPVTLSVTSDSTSWGASGPSFTNLFGIGAGVQADRAGSFSIRPSILQNPNLLPIARVNQSAAAGTPAVVSGDGSGAILLSNIGSAKANFAQMGGTGGVMSIDNYASQLAGAIGEQAASIKSQQTGASNLQTQAQSQLSSAEGVNLDQELTNLTIYQQAYNASARLIQAAHDMSTTLLSLIPMTG
jgi:flagellar hook-associated protein 1 FlgK